MNAARKKARRKLKAEARARARTLELDEMMTRIAAERVSAWLRSPAGTPYDNTPLRELAEQRIKEGNYVR